MNTEIGRRMRDARIAHGYTLGQVAEMITISIPLLLRIENGELNPEDAFVIRFCEALRVPYDFLVQGEIDPVASLVITDPAKLDAIVKKMAQRPPLQVAQGERPVTFTITVSTNVSAETLQALAAMLAQIQTQIEQHVKTEGGDGR